MSTSKPTNMERTANLETSHELAARDQRSYEELQDICKRALALIEGEPLEARDTTPRFPIPVLEDLITAMPDSFPHHENAAHSHFRAVMEPANLPKKFDTSRSEESGSHMTWAITSSSTKVDAHEVIELNSDASPSLGTALQDGDVFTSATHMANKLSKKQDEPEDDEIVQFDPYDADDELEPATPAVPEALRCYDELVRKRKADFDQQELQLKEASSSGPDEKRKLPVPKLLPAPVMKRQRVQGVLQGAQRAQQPDLRRNVLGGRETRILTNLQRYRAAHRNDIPIPEDAEPVIQSYERLNIRGTRPSDRGVFASGRFQQVQTPIASIFVTQPERSVLGAGTTQPSAVPGDGTSEAVSH